MPRDSLVDTAVVTLLDEIIDSGADAEQPLPTQQALADQHGVSRLTIREAVRVLQEHNVLRVEQGRGTYVNPRSQWTSLVSVHRASSRATGSIERSLSLLEVRRIIEVEAARLAASRRTPDDLSRLRAAHARMEEAEAAGDAKSSAAADLDFHNAIISSCGNPYLTALYSPLTDVIASLRIRTVSWPEVCRHAIDEHRAILATIGASSPDAAAAAMRSHMDQTVNDLLRYLPAEQPLPAERPPPDSAMNLPLAGDREVLREAGLRVAPST